MTSPRFLGQAAFTEKSIRDKTVKLMTEAHQLVQTPALLTGQRRDYTPLLTDETGEAEQLPSVRERVQFTVAEVIDGIRDQIATMLDATAAKDWTNCGGDTTFARANVVVGDQTLIENAPVPFLLWLEHQLDNWETFALKLPTHDPVTEWTLDDERGVYRSLPQESIRQIQRPMSRVVAPSNGQVPPVVRDWTENVPTGRWTVVKLTGAIPTAERAAMIRRIRELRRAVGIAREEANRTEAVQPVIGDRLVSYVFG